MASQVREEVEVFISTAVSLTRQIQLFEQLFTDEESLESLGRFPESFSIIQRTMLKSIVVGVCAFFDPPQTFGKANLSLRYIEEKYSDNLSAESIEYIEKAKRIYEKLNISQYRHKYLAHHDLSHYTKVDKISHDITTEDLQDLLISLMKVGMSIDNGGLSVSAEQIFHNSRLRPDDSGLAIAKALKAGV